MASPGVVMPAMGAMIAIYAIPPALILLSCLRRRARAQYLGNKTTPFVAGAIAGGIALAFNLAVVLPTLISLPEGALDLTNLSFAGLAISWICFWAWVALHTFLKRSRRRVTL